MPYVKVEDLEVDVDKMTSKEVKDYVSKHRLGGEDYVTKYMELTNYESGKLSSFLGEFTTFLDENGLDADEVTMVIDTYDGCYPTLELRASKPLSVAILREKIKDFMVSVKHERKMEKERKKKREKSDRQTYERLKKRFEKDSV